MTAYPPPEGQQPQTTPPPPPSGYPPPPPAYPPPAQGQPGSTWQPGQRGQLGQPQGFRPPQPPGTVATEPAPPVAWLIPVAALLAVIGAFTPWFTPHGEVRTISRDFDSLYSFRDGKIGLIAPIVLVALSISVIGLLRGKRTRRLANAADPVRALGKYSIIAGLVSLVCLGIAWFLVTTQYKFTLSGQEVSWDDFENRLKALGGTLSRGPQIGYFLTIAAAVLAIIGGVLMMTMSKKTAVPAANGATPPPPPNYGPPSLQKQPEPWPQQSQQWPPQPQAQQPQAQQPPAPQPQQPPQG